MLRRDVLVLFASLTLAPVARAAPSSLVTSAAPAGASAGTTKLVYKVRHSRYGDLGTFTNTVQHSGDKTTVTSDAHYKVGALGVTFYRQDVSRVETWSGDRLVAFHGVTSVNGKAVELNGKADGDQFVLMTPEGTVKAPATVRVANPWSRISVQGDFMLTPDAGRLEKIKLSGMEDATVRVGAKTVHAKHFAVLRGEGPRRYEIWLDDADMPVQFAVVGPNETITFTLQA